MIITTATKTERLSLSAVLVATRLPPLALSKQKLRVCSEGQGGGCLLNPSGSCAAGNTSSVQLYNSNSLPAAEAIALRFCKGRESCLSCSLATVYSGKIDCLQLVPDVLRAAFHGSS